MGFDYNSRTKWEKAKTEKWNAEKKMQAAFLSASSKELLEEIGKFSTYPTGSFPVIRKWSRDHAKGSERTLKEIMTEDAADLLRLLVPEGYREDYLYLLDQLPSYQYSRALFRPTVRTAEPLAHTTDAFGLMQAYKVLGIYGITPAQYLTAKGPAPSFDDPELADFISNDSYGRDLHLPLLDDILAARIDLGDEDVVEEIREAILSDNNTVLVSVPMIRAIVKSKNTELHDLLGRFLLAARLQEGVRQAICENADCGRPEAFMTILKVIEDNNLIRFSAVKRAVATWTGIFNADSADRVSEKTLSLIGEGLRDKKAALAMTETDDAVQIVTGLWALGFYEASDAVSRMAKIADEGTRPQRLAISYYNHYMVYSDLREKAAKKVLSLYPDDPQMAAAFLPTFLDYTDTMVRGCIKSRSGKDTWNLQEKDAVYESVAVTELFDSEAEAWCFYGIFRNLADSMKKKKLEFVPMIFPWYGASLEKSDLVQRMVLIAYALQDQGLIDQVCVRLTDISDSYYNTRRNYLRILLHDPRTPVQKDALIGYAADKESMTRNSAFQILQLLPLTEEDYEKLEKHLRLKNEETRHNVIELLERQEGEALQRTMERLLSSGQENIRLAGLDMLKRRLEKDPSLQERGRAFLKKVLPDESVLSEKEKVLYEAIGGSGGDESALNLPGYGLYDPGADYQPDLSGLLPEKKEKKASSKGLFGKAMEMVLGSGSDRAGEILKEHFSLTAAQMDRYLDRIREFVAAHGNLEYTSCSGEKQLLKHGLFLTNYEYTAPIEDRYPFPDLWKEVYETILKEPEVVWGLYFALQSEYGESDIKDIYAFRRWEKTLFGEAAGYSYSGNTSSGPYRHSVYETILAIIMSQQGISLPREAALAACIKSLALPEDIRWMERVPAKYRAYNEGEKACFIRTGKFRYLMQQLYAARDESRFRQTFPLFYQTDRIYDFGKNSPDRTGNSSSGILCIYDYVRARELGLISEDFLYKAVFEIVGLRPSMGKLGDMMRPLLYVSTANELVKYAPVDREKRTIDRTSAFFVTGEKLYKTLTDLILDVELKRGDTPTVFSSAVSRITRIEGIPRLMELLRALGADALDRSAYYAYSYSAGTGRTECLSHLLKVCYPAAGESAADLKKAVKAAGTTTDRLIEVAMFAPQWMELMEEVLGIEGLTSGCYYFMAHMNERFDDKKKAVIARYTPLSPEELNNGCFDTNWFFEVYEKLGEKNFARLYKAAKYIADGSKHTRARKFADAATGKVDRDQLEKTIEDKRNKDLVLSYGLIPMKDREDALHRYEFLQKFLKESRQFGAQRRASEAQCVQYAMKNMATTAGYADELRLTLAMETELVSTGERYFEGTEIGEILVKVQVDDNGKAELIVTKKGKALKSAPAALKKDPVFTEIKDFAAKLKNQYSRCVAMFERAMEEEDAYSYGELSDLCRNPVTAGILRRLVFISAEGEDPALTGTLEEISGKSPSREAKLLVAHPIALYRRGLLPAYQRLFFEKNRETGLKQPFKQVFREFYVKLEEEMEAADSRMFAGYQIQPKKTLAALKGRRWVADYESGLQKIYFRQNIAVTIYALADWFSPADTEAPTLEFVSFYDRKTYKQIKIKDVPEVLYSEVMRDVDLAVSVAHVGGVDPETSHSTVEMRKVILEFNKELFGLDNVRIEGTHAFIEGKLGSYTVQLGSGVIHKEGGAMINILPVHSQQRGKLFLPFIDEDPKTAEILSKVLLLAEDRKIKDPYILDQLK